MSLRLAVDGRTPYTQNNTHHASLILPTHHPVLSTNENYMEGVNAWKYAAVFERANFASLFIRFVERMVSYNARGISFEEQDDESTTYIYIE